MNVGPEGCFADFVTDWIPLVKRRLTLKRWLLNRGHGAERNDRRQCWAVPIRLTTTVTGTNIVWNVNTAMDFTFNANVFFHRSTVIDGVPVNVFFLSGGQEKADLYSSKAMEVIARSTRLDWHLPVRQL